MPTDDGDPHASRGEVLACFEGRREQFWRRFRVETRSREVAEDLVGQMRVKILRAKNLPRPGEEPPWLNTMATNLLTDHFRWIKTRARDVSTDDFLEILGTQLRFIDVLASEDISPETAAVDDDLSDAIAAALLRLSDIERLVLLLRYEQGFSVADTADFVNSSSTAFLRDNQVRKREGEALRQVRAMLARAGFRVPNFDAVEREKDGGSGRLSADFLAIDVANIRAIDDRLNSMATGAARKLLQWLDEDETWKRCGCRACSCTAAQLAAVFNDTTKKALAETFCIFEEHTWMAIPIPDHAKDLAKIQADRLTGRQRVLLNRFFLNRLLDLASLESAWEIRNARILMSELQLP